MGDMFGGGGDSPDADPEIRNAALRNVQIGQDWLNFARDAYASGQERQKGIDATADSASSLQLGLAKDAGANYAQIMDRYKNLFQPTEDRVVNDANTWDSAENQTAAAAKAKADVLRESASAEAANDRQMAAYGVSPSSGRFAGAKRAGSLNTGLASVGAQNNARDTLKMQGNSMRQQAAQLGLNTTSVASNNAGLGVNAGTAAVGNKLAANNADQQNKNVMASGFSGAMTGNNTAANILNQNYQNEIAKYSSDSAAGAAGMGGLMNAVGTGVGAYFSSKEYKTDKKPAPDALEAIKGLPVESWNYKPGVADGGAQRHVGPYAEDFKAATGSGDGKSIPIQDAIGLTMKAVQELDAKFESLKAAS